MSGERLWTDAQRSAIDTRGRTLLVSAAAGSGKTSVLTERIVRAITDPDRPCDLMRILAVTFTRSAARDLREKLSVELRRALAREPGNRRLAAQINCLPAAHICTIDSFCLDLVRGYSSALGIPRAFRLADNAENLLLCSSVMGNLISDLYDGLADDCPISAEEFSAAADLLTRSKEEDRLSDVLLSLWEDCNGYPDGTARLVACAEEIAEADSPLDSPAYRDAALAELRELFVHFMPVFDSYIPPFAACEPLSVKYLPAAEYGRELCRLALEAIGRGDTKRLRALVSDFAPPPISVSSKKITEDERALTERFKKDRSAFGDEMGELSTKYFSYSVEDMRALRGPLISYLRIVAQVVDTFNRRLASERRARGVLSFADLERLTLDMLRGDGEGRSHEAEEIASQFDLIFVDEYQDVNPIQHSIFSLISQSDNLFMVGDVKQSIYSFRGAAPEVFTSLRKSFAPLTPELPSGEPAAIDMSSNFRSDNGVIRFVNLVFDRAFSLFAETSGYIPERDRLIYAKLPKKSPEETPRTVVAVFSKKKEADAETDVAEGEEASETEPPISETEFVIDEIRRLMREQGYKPKDFAILVRNGGQAAHFAAALAESGIDTDGASEDDFFSFPEILLARCLLNAVDNPRRDTYLAGLMMSPLFDFSADELVEIRLDSAGEAGETLWEALRRYVETHPGYTHGADFIERLGYFRRISEGLPADELLWRLYEETGFFSAIGGEGGGARERLLRLYDWARAFEGGSYHGLWHFITYLDELIEKGKTPGEGKLAGAGESVHVMTAHSSKGLEFPVCFVCGTDVSYNFMSLNRNTVFDGELGAMLRLRSEDGFALIDNPYRAIVCDRIRRRQREEELRLLYVALTRARERLYVCASPAKSTKLDRTMETLAADATPAIPLTPYMIFSAKGAFEALSAILPYTSVEERDCFELLDLRHTCRADLNAVIAAAEAERAPTERVLDAEEQTRYEALLPELERRLTFEYPRRALTVLPKKLPVSALREGLLDRDAEVAAAVEALDEGLVTEPEEREEASKDYHVPRFMGGADEHAAAQRGIATHLFMQFCDFDRLCRDGVDAEADRLVVEGFVSKADAALIRRNELRRFRESDLLGLLRSARALHRELRFNLNISAASLTLDHDLKRALGDQLLLVQGVIDCVAETESGELVLVDYKTDRPPRRDATRAEIEAALRERHSDQLSYYKRACEAIFGRPPARTLIYSLYLGDTVEI